MTASKTSQRGTALITGASTGIGATYAERLAQRGYDLVLVARDKSRLQALAARLSAETGVRTEVLAADLTDTAQRALVEQKLREDTSITLLLNNAGMAVMGSLVEADIDAVQTMLELNITAPTRLAAAAAKAFVSRGAGTIINIASVLALAPEMFSGTYSGTKAYMLNLSHSMRAQLAPLGVTVQAVLPGATRTEIWDRAGMSADSLPSEMLMEVGDLVDAALAGLDMGEAVTIPPLQDLAGFTAMETARLALAPQLSKRLPAGRYRESVAAI